ncbi:MAG: metalloregulator ArsR/SmtB family transcription factor [bacterium]|nr:metalloregulator ArsR/SmtB family transcription factor [bacterium]
MRDLIRALKAISDETRVRIMKVLLEKESLCVCEIMQALDITQTRASKNLRILKDAGFVVDRREGSWVHYSVDEGITNRYCKSISLLLKEWLNDSETIMEDKRRLSEAIKLSKTKHK